VVDLVAKVHKVNFERLESMKLMGFETDGEIISVSFEIDGL
jgi:hypothetical protein